MEHRTFRVTTDVWATQGQRFINYIIDWVIQFALLFCLTIVATILASAMGSNGFIALPKDL